MADYTEDVQKPVTDDFIGSNGDPPSSVIWSLNAGAVGPEIQSNKCRIGVDSGDTIGGIFTNFYPLPGDFEVQIDWDTFNVQNTNNWYARLIAYDRDDFDTYTDVRYSFSSSTYRVIALRTGDVDFGSQNFAGNENTGKLKLVRTGSTVEAFYDIGSGFVSLGDDGGNGCGNVEVRLAIRIDVTSGNPSTTVDFDNFIADYVGPPLTGADFAGVVSPMASYRRTVSGQF